MKAYCCHIGCEADATYHIQGPDHYDNYTHMCAAHVEEYTAPDDTVYPIKQKELEAND